MNGHLFTIVIQLARLDLGINPVFIQLFLDIGKVSDSSS